MCKDRPYQPPRRGTGRSQERIEILDWTKGRGRQDPGEITGRNKMCRTDPGPIDPRHPTQYRGGTILMPPHPHGFRCAVNNLVARTLGHTGPFYIHNHQDNCRYKRSILTMNRNRFRIAVAGTAVAVAIATSACETEDDRGLGDAPSEAHDDSTIGIYTNADAYPNISTLCVGGNGVYSTTREAAVTVIVGDPECEEGGVIYEDMRSGHGQG